MGVYSTYLMLLLAWTDKQSLCNPIITGGEDYSEQILLEEFKCCPVLEGCPKSVPLCSSLGGEDYSKQMLVEEFKCCPVLEGCLKSIPLCSSIGISE